MADFQPPPTYAEVVLVDERTGKSAFNPIWLKWFIDLVGNLGPGGAGTVTSIDVSGGTTGLTTGGGPVTTNGTITLSGILVGASGGTGVANIGKTITLGGNLTTTPANAITFTTTGATNVTLPTSGTLGTGTVTSVAQSFTGGLISVAGSPVTSSGTLALTVAGTSGGVPYFSGATTWASSGALTASAIVLGGGAGNAPTVLGSLGTTTTVLHGNASGAPTFGAVSLTADVTGTLGAANGGTGVANNAASTVTISGNFATTLTVTGTTSITLPTSGTLATTTSGSFTGTLTGVTASVTGTFNWVKVGRSVTIGADQALGLFTGTSNTTSKTITGMPSNLFPGGSVMLPGCITKDSGGPYTGGTFSQLKADGVMDFTTTASGSGWTASGTCEIYVPHFSYLAAT